MSNLFDDIIKEEQWITITKIDKDRGGFDIELDNKMELELAANGTIQKTEYDD